MNIIKTTDNELESIRSINALGSELLFINIDSAELLSQQALNISNEYLKNPKGDISQRELKIEKSESLYNLGRINYLRLDYKLSISYFEQALNFKKDVKDYENLSHLYSLLGDSYFHIGDLKSAIDYSFKNLELNLVLDDKYVVAWIYHNIGYIKMKMEDYDNADEMYDKALKMAFDLKDTVMQSTIRNSKAELYIYQEKFESSNYELKKSIELVKGLNEKYLATPYALLGRIKIEINQFDSSLYYINKSYEISKKKNNIDNQLKILYYKSILFERQRKYNDVIEIGNQLLDLSISVRNLFAQKNAYEILCKAYENKGDITNAYKYYKRYIEVKNELSLEESKNILLQTELKFQNEQRIKEDSVKFSNYSLIKENQLKLQKLEVDQEKKARTFLFVILGVVLIALFGFIRSLIVKKKDNEIILYQKEAVENQNIMLEDQNQRLKSKATLFKVLRNLSSDLSLSEILHHTLMETLEVDWLSFKNTGAIYLIDNNKLILKEEINYKEEDVLLFDIEYYQKIFEQGNEKILFTDNSNFRQLSIPIKNKNKIVGLIILLSVTDSEFTNDQIEFIESISILLGETIYRHTISQKLRLAHMENTLKKKEVELANEKVNYSLQKQSAINQLMKSIILNENIGEKVYNYISDIFNNVDIKRLNITLFDFDNSLVRFYFLRENGMDKSLNQVMPLSDFSNETISKLKENKRVVVSSIKNKEKFSESDKEMLKNNINSFVSFPLYVDNLLLGALNLSFENDIKFNEEQEEFITLLVEGVKIAIFQNDLSNKLLKTNTKLLELNKEVSDSINYANRLQEAVLPTEDFFNELFPHNFIIYQQKDIVGGDFYWVNSYQINQKMIAVIDCTGHGIPGAFMTMIGRLLLRETTSVKNILRPDLVLEEMDRVLRKILRQDSYDSMQDGMDITICHIDEDKIQFSSAQRPFIIKKKNSKKIELIKGSSFPVGGYFETEKSYSLIEYDRNEIDSFYLFSDGFTDQFGGENVKKYGTNRFMENLSLVMEMPMSNQKDFLWNELQNWKGHLNQIDDILVLGIKLEE